jgi:hypothetical protein
MTSHIDGLEVDLYNLHADAGYVLCKVLVDNG